MENLINQLSTSPKIGLQTINGIRFVKLQSIVFIRLEKEEHCHSGRVVVYLIDGKRIVLASGTTLKKIKGELDGNVFIEVCRQAILNISYLREVENGKEKVCRFAEPYQDMVLKISRNNMVELRKRFKII